MEETKKTTKGKKKGTTMPLGQFLGSDAKVISVQAKNWSEIVDDQEAEESKPVFVDIGGLPTAPRGSVDVVIPSEPPFIAHVSNLSFEIDDERLRRIFADLNVKAARVMKDGTRSRGVGLVEFEKREDLIEALKKHDKEHYGRNIRVNVSDKPEIYSNDNNRGFGNNRSSNRNTTGEERPEMSGTWKRAEPRSDGQSEGRSSGGYNRDRQNRNDYGRSNTGGSGGGGSRDNQQGNDYGYGYPRSRDDRGTGGNRDYRSGQRNRPQDDNERSNSGVDRPRYGGRYSDTRDTRNQNNQGTDEPRADPQEAPRERPRLQLQPRSKPLEDIQPLSGSSSSVNNVAANAEQSLTSNPDDSSSSLTNSTNQQNPDSPGNEAGQDNEQSTVKLSRGAGASIFGGAKPVDTAARELEIEKKLRETQLTSSEPTADTEEKKPPSRPSYGRGSDRDNYRGKRSSQTDEHRERRGDGRSSHGGDYQHRQENTGGRQYDDESRRRNDDDQSRRGGGHDRDRYSGPSRRDYDSNRSNKYNHPERDNERGNYRNRNQDTSESHNQGRSSNPDDFISESQPRHPQRNLNRRTVQTEEDSNRLQLSNKFCMLDDDDLDDNETNENDNDQSPNIEE